MTERDGTGQRHPPAIFLMGPTASGKTDLAIELTRELPCDIISVDSAMIYRGMDIGTAKPTAQELARAPHRLINLCDPAEVYSVAEFQRDALAAMAEITAAGRIPLLVGGTMMYFKALLNGLSDLPPADPALRSRLQERAGTEGWPALHEALRRIDPEAARRIHVNNRQRLLRALEVIETTGRPISELWQGDTGGGREGVEDYPYFTRWQADVNHCLPYTVVQIAIAPEDRRELHRRIDVRFQAMLENGFLDEVRCLMARGDLHPSMPSMRCVGYRQAWEYLAGETDHATMVRKGQAATRQLAKRQLTWLRKWQDVEWFRTNDPQNVSFALKIFRLRTTLNGQLS